MAGVVQDKNERERLHNLCLFCCKAINEFEGPPNVLPKSVSLDGAKNILKLFFTSLERFLGVSVSKLVFGGDSNIFEEDDRLTVEVCQNCQTLVSSFCELYNTLKCLELKLQWKTRNLIQVMKESSRVQSRMKLVKQIFEKVDQNRANLGNIRCVAFMETREKMIRECGQRLSRLAPAVILEKLKLTSSEMQSPIITQTKSEINTNLGNWKQTCSAWIISFAAVVVLLLSPNSNVGMDVQSFMLEDVGVDVPIDDEVDNAINTQRSSIIHTDVELLQAPHGVHTSGQSTAKSLKLSSWRDTSDVQGDYNGNIKSECYFNNDNASSDDPEVMPDDRDVKSLYVNDFEEDIQSRGDEHDTEEAGLETKTMKVETITVETNKSQKRKFLCNHCDKSYPSKSAVGMHVRTRHPEMYRKSESQKNGTFFCKICKKSYSSYFGYITHRKSVMHMLRSKKKNHVIGIKTEKEICDDNVSKSTAALDNNGDQAEETDKSESKIINEDNNSTPPLPEYESNVRYNLRNKRPRFSTNQGHEVQDHSAEAQDSDSGSSFHDFSSVSSSSLSSSSYDSVGEDMPGQNQVKVETITIKRQGRRRKRPYSEDGWKYCRLDGCNYAAPGSTAYNEHKRLHENGNYSCKFCKVVKNNALKLSCHEVKAHFKPKSSKNKYAFNCPRCPYSALRRLSYVNHFAKTHLGFDKFSSEEECPTCQVPISTSWQHQHFSKHHDVANVAADKILKCQEKDCTAYFVVTKSRNMYKLHMRHAHNFSAEVSSSEEELHCKVCDKSFVSVYQFQNHKRLYHKRKTSGAEYGDEINQTILKTLICPAYECTKSFKQMEVLEKHKKLHGGFKCNFCDIVKEYAPDLSLHELEHSAGTSRKVRADVKFKCSRCVFTSGFRAWYITHHLEAHLGITDRIFSCSLCDGHFRTNRVKKAHYNSHHDKSPAHEEKCSKAFVIQDQKYILKKRSNGRIDYQCSASGCSELFGSQEDLEKHLKLHGDFKCEFCLIYKEYAFDLAIHEIEHEPTTAKKGMTKCPRCSYCSKAQSAYICHFAENHLNLDAKVHTCSICKASAFSRDSIRKHYEKMHKTEAVDPGDIQNCDQCSAYFLTRIQLLQHKRLSHEDKSLDCVQCRKTFKARKSLSQHLLKFHGAEKDSEDFEFSCDKPNCGGMRFKTSDELEWHKTFGQCVKSTAKENITCEKCGKVYKGNQALKLHMKKLHREGRPTEFKCDKCDKVFSRKANLQSHQRFHVAPEKWEYMCAACSKMCVDKYTLKSHMNTHTKDKPFVCQVCGERYAHRHNLRNHVNSKHKDEGVEDIAKKMNRKNVVSRKGKKLDRGFCFTSSGAEAQSQ